MHSRQLSQLAKQPSKQELVDLLNIAIAVVVAPSGTNSNTKRKRLCALHHLCSYVVRGGCRIEGTQYTLCTIRSKKSSKSRLKVPITHEILCILAGKAHSHLRLDWSHGTLLYNLGDRIQFPNLPWLERMNQRLCFWQQSSTSTSHAAVQVARHWWRCRAGVVRTPPTQ